MSRWQQFRADRDADLAAEEPQRDGSPAVVRVREGRRALPIDPQAGRARARRLLQPLPLAGAVLVLIALAGYLALYAQATRGTAVLIATHDLPAGTILRADDVRVGTLAGDRATMGALIPNSELQDELGRTVQAGVAAGSPIARAALGRTAAQPASFTLTVPALHALGGELQPGDRISVLATYEQASGTARARAVARSLLVVAVGAPPTGIDAGSATIPVTVELPDPSLASALALANSAAKIDLLREGSRSGSAPIAPASEGGG